MKKITTLYKKDPNDLWKVINEINPENEWVFTEWIPTRKFDWTSCAIIDWKLYKRYDAKNGKTAPDNGIACQEKDEITWQQPFWIPCDKNNNANKYHFEWYDNLIEKIDWTYELCWPKIENNPEWFVSHILIPHGKEVLEVSDLSFEWLKSFLSSHDIEGIVFHWKEGKMCKIRKTDFNIKR